LIICRQSFELLVLPFKFTGKLDKLTLTIDRPQLSPADIEAQVSHAQ